LDDHPGPKKTSKKPGRNSPELAANDIGGSSCSAPTHDESYSERKQRNTREQAILKRWAQEREIFGGTVPENKFDGGEHRVDFDIKRDRHLV
jgi:hypothetical protein